MELVKSPKECCGCGACALLCPKGAVTMQENREGFLYPKIEKYLCIDCGSCLRACGFRNGERIESFRETYAACARDGDWRQSASGGLFAGLALAVLDKGGAVFGCAMVYEDGRLIPRHMCVREKKELTRLKGSKYVQSRMGNIYTEVQERLQEGDSVLFCGTPCQVMGLRSYLQKNYDNLYTAELVCHGVPSAKLFQDYIASVEKKEKKKVIDFQFRDKSQGWRLYGSMVLSEENGRKTKKFFEPEDSSYYQLFLRGDTYRESCYDCPFASVYRSGDITIGDYWGIELVHPEYLTKNGGALEEQKGISCLIVNNEQGRRLLEKYGQGIERYASSYDKAARYNGQLLHACDRKKERDRVMVLAGQGYEQVEKWYQRRRIRSRIQRKLRSMVPGKVKYGIRKLNKWCRERKKYAKGERDRTGI